MRHQMVPKHWKYIVVALLVLIVCVSAYPAHNPAVLTEDRDPPIYYKGDSVTAVINHIDWTSEVAICEGGSSRVSLGNGSRSQHGETHVSFSITVQPLESVSYTPLRANETEAGLECRLLREK